MGVGGQRHALTLYPREKDPVPTVLEAGWAPGPVWKGAENLAPTDNRSPDRAARGKSLYRLSYPGVTVPFHFNFRSIRCMMMPCNFSIACHTRHSWCRPVDMMCAEATSQ